MFLEDSESDGSINTTTTAESQDSDKEYNIEHILSEIQDEAGELQYLIKWEGYPLYQATWEPADKFTEYDDLLRAWEGKKRNARLSGGVPLFDVEEFYKAVEVEEEKRLLKRRKRVLKRRKKGNYVPSEEDEDDDEDDLPTTQAPKSTRAKAVPGSPVKRKRSADGGGKRIALAASEDDGDDVDSPSGNPKDASSLSKKRGSVVPPVSPRQASASIANVRRGSESKNNPSVSTGSRDTSSTSTAKRTSTATRTSILADPIATARRSKNVFAGDWNVMKKRRMRPTVSGETPKNSTDPKFKSLAEQNRFQKYGRQNEPAPNLEALAIVDPRTGRVQKPAQSARKNADINRAYGRRSPPRRTRERSRSTSPLMRDLREDQMPTTATPSILSKPTENPKEITCKDWRYGTCQYTAETCPYAHNDIQKGVTCFYWRKGDKCKFTAENCNFAHHDTGVYAGPPGTFLGADESKANVTCYFWKTRGMCTKLSSCQYAHSDTGIYAGPPGTNQVTYRDDQAPQAPVVAANAEPLNQIAAEDDDAFAPPPSSPEKNVSEAPLMQVNTTATKPASLVPAPYGNPPSPTTDPRLRGRSSISGRSMIDSSAGSILPPMTPGNDYADIPNANVAHQQKILEQEFEIAKRAVPELDFKPLVQTKDGNLIQHVFLQIPKGRSGEMNVLRRRLEGWNCKIFTSRDRDHWDFFKRYKECLIIVHPMENFCGTMPGLYNHLMRGSTINVYSIGVQHAQCIMEHREPAYEAHRIFPMGGITFITDDVFVYYPEKATEIIENFYAVAKGKAIGGEFSKIGARPGIKDWLLRLAQRKWEEQKCPDEEKDLRWIQAYDAICQLCPIEDEDPRWLPDRGVPLERSWLWSADETHFHDFAGRWERGDEEGATEYMVEFFAGEAVCSVAAYRRFVVVYQRPGKEMIEEGKKSDPRGWMEKYSHIGVMTPERYLASKKS